jgi:hypothetical protein
MSSQGELVHRRILAERFGAPIVASAGTPR